MARTSVLTEAERNRVTAAVAAAEAMTDAEIVTVVAPESDSYRDVADQFGVIAMLLTVGVAALLPDKLEALIFWWSNGWEGAALLERGLFAVMLAEALVFLVVRYLVSWAPLRRLLTPAGIRSRRVRRRAVQYFKVGAESRTAAKVGVLLFLSLSERRAEIVTDEAVHRAVPEALWGEAMTDLVREVAVGRVGDGLVAAVGRIGTTLSEQFPKTSADTNELPDRVILL